MLQFQRITNGFNYVFEKKFAENETVIVQMPPVSSNKRGINDIGWQSDGDVSLYGTLSVNPEKTDSLWQKIEPFDEINKTASALKIVNEGKDCTVIIRALFN